MVWTYKYNGIDDAGLDEKWDKIIRSEPVKKSKGWNIEEVVRIREQAKRDSEIPKIKEVDDIPVRGRWDRVNGFRYYLDKVTDFGIVGKRCYLTIQVMGKSHNVHVPDTPEWNWLKSVIMKRKGSGNDK